ncbi:uncharacterized protein BDZ99DRAFT_473212 [Mytilinidion resinicola]|uniref:Uncharacterized protein n=1 Tax=Mytilinidion resinicola TaxID=574789 RepID=A0A6A6Z1N6_9PEZI|nr:uncharacterized protein BDZ99DRAFT_473212 [Mytilinidion resinicola]KAF2814095.1 hypothetical protein BDZ99DRAFT_473212 [Mytilinidion resinicola]
MASNNTTTPARDARKHTLSETRDNDEKGGVSPPRKISKVEQGEKIDSVDMPVTADKPVMGSPTVSEGFASAFYHAGTVEHPDQKGESLLAGMHQLPKSLDEQDVTIGGVDETSAINVAVELPDQKGDALLAGVHQLQSMGVGKLGTGAPTLAAAIAHAVDTAVQQPSKQVARSSLAEGLQQLDVDPMSQQEAGSSSLAMHQLQDQPLDGTSQLMDGIEQESQQGCAACVNYGLSGDHDHQGRPCSKRFRKAKRLGYYMQWDGAPCAKCLPLGLQNPWHPSSCCNADLRDKIVQSLAKKKADSDDHWFRNELPRRQLERMDLRTLMVKAKPFMELEDKSLIQKYVDNVLEPYVLLLVEKEEKACALVFCILLYFWILQDMALLLMAFDAFT